MENFKIEEMDDISKTLNLINKSIHVMAGIVTYINTHSYEKIKYVNNEIMERMIVGHVLPMDVSEKNIPKEVEIIVNAKRGEFAIDNRVFLEQVKNVIQTIGKNKILFIRCFPLEELMKGYHLPKYRCRLFFIPQENIVNYKQIDEIALEESWI